ncbi:MAG: class I SAM-dependent methyltransferase [Saprospiraceae bacterium]
MNHSAGVKNYYEKNTRRFLRFHRDAATKSIHQPLWKELNFTLKEAVFYANKLIQKEIEDYPQKVDLTIIDLGCGVGSSLFYLVDNLKTTATYYGISISETQIDIAKNEVTYRKHKEQTIPNFHFIVADFTQLPSNIPTVDIAFSIEAFVHASAAEKYLAQISPYLKKGGKLILIDDFINNEVDRTTLDEVAQKALADFEYGWMVNSLKTTKKLGKIAANYGLQIIAEQDLTPYMRNNTLKHKWIRFLVFSFRWLYDLLPQKSAYFRSWIGGVGKQYCLRKGIVKYKKIVLEKVV